MRRLLSSRVVVVSVVALAGSLPAGAPPAEGKGPARTSVRTTTPLIPLDIVDYVLANGLRVVLSPDRHAPTVGVAVYYDVGSREEAPGRTGLAHFLEHLAFQGSRNLDAGKHLQMIHEAGGEADGATYRDRTAFYEEIPPQYLERVLWAEADRMREPYLTQVRLDRERRRILAESMVHESGEYAQAEQRLDQLAFTSFAYGHPVTGVPGELDALSLDDVKQFRQRYYRPPNAVLAVAGDFDEAQARGWIEKYFGAIERGPADFPVAGQTGGRPALGQAFQNEEKTAELRDPLSETSKLLMAYHVPESRSPEWYALDLAATILGGGESSRLVDRLVSEKKIATAVSAGIDADFLRGPGLLKITVALAPGHEVAEARVMIDREMENLRRTGVTARELGRARNRARAALAAALATSGGRAQRLAEFALFWGDPRKLRDEHERYLAITASDVQRAAERHLVRSNRAVVEVLPPERPSVTDPGKEKKAP